MHYTINLQPQVDTLDGRHVPALIALWLDDIAATATPLTHESYCIQIAPVLRWLACRADAPDFVIGVHSLRECAHWLATAPAVRTGRPLGWHAQNDALRRLRQCLRWGHSRGSIPVDCSVWVPAPAGDKPTVRRRARLGDLERLMATARKSRSGERDVALIALLIGTGLRRTEAVALDIDDLRLDADRSGTVTVRNAKRVAGRMVQGRLVAVDSWTGDYMAHWLAMRPANGPMWVQLSRDRRHYTGARLSARQVTRIVADTAEAAGIGELIQGPHDLRRHFATWFAAQNVGNPLAGRLLSKQLGHSRFTMTERYILDDEEELRDIIRSPLAGRRSLW